MIAAVPRACGCRMLCGMKFCRRPESNDRIHHRAACSDRGKESRAGPKQQTEEQNSQPEAPRDQLLLDRQQRLINASSSWASEGSSNDSPADGSD